MKLRREARLHIEQPGRPFRSGMEIDTVVILSEIPRRSKRRISRATCSSRARARARALRFYISLLLSCWLHSRRPCCSTFAASRNTDVFIHGLYGGVPLPSRYNIYTTDPFIRSNSRFYSTSARRRREAVFHRDRLNSRYRVSS